MKNERTPVLRIIMALFLLITMAIAAQAIPTKVVVRAKAKDAKFIGTSVGGAYVTISNATTGVLLAEGRTIGSTGNTTAIMKTPIERYTSIVNEETAAFTTVLNLADVLFAQIDVYAPITKKQATVLASTQVWLIPGKHMDGDGIVLEIPGFIIDILNPQTHQFIPWHDASMELTVAANVVMMCGCTISEGGLWDGSAMEVRALVKRNNQLIGSVPLAITDISNVFEGTLVIPEKGDYEIAVYAYDPRTKNTGVDRINFIVE